MRKKLLYFGLIAVVAAAGYAYWMFNKPHEDIRKTKPFAAYKAEQLLIEFSKDYEGADAILVDKVIILEGLVTKTKVEEDHTVFTFDYDKDFALQAYLSNSEPGVAEVQIHSYVIMKCKYSGYMINDEDFLIPADIKIEQCYIVK